MLLQSEIKREIESGNILIRPYNEKQLNSNSYNVLLGGTLAKYKNSLLDSAGPCELVPIELKEIDGRMGWMLEPGTLYLGQTHEYTECHGNIVPCINGRSSTGRLGVWVHVSAGFGDVGYRGKWTLEIVVVQPTILYPLTPICQLFWEEGRGVAPEYKGQYQDSFLPRASGLWQDAILLDKETQIEVLNGER